MEHDKTINDLKKSFDKEEVKFQLTCASLFLTAYEVLITKIQDKIKEYYIIGFNSTEIKYSENYDKVRDLYPKDIIIASAMWLEKNGVITNEETKQIIEFKRYRNEVAHEIHQLIGDSHRDVKIEYIQQIRDIAYKIHYWWYVEFESFDDEDENLIFKIEDVLWMPMSTMDTFVAILNDEVKKRDERKNTI